MNNLWFTQADTLFVTGGEDQIDARPLTERTSHLPIPPGNIRRHRVSFVECGRNPMATGAC